jgi:hypothetical protein
MRSIASRMSVMSGEGALSVFARAKELERQGHSIIHLELGEPDFHPGASVVESAAKARCQSLLGPRNSSDKVTPSSILNWASRIFIRVHRSSSQPRRRSPTAKTVIAP